RGELWLDMGEPIEVTIAAAVRDAVAVDKRAQGVHTDVRVAREDDRNYTVHVDVAGTAEGFGFRRRLATRARVKGGTCLRCSRITGGYFEATIQVRASKRDLSGDEVRRTRAICSRMIDRIVSEGDRNAFVLRDEEIHGGLDIVVGTTNAARMMAKALLQEFGGKVTESARLAGKKDGNDLYRITFAIRLPEYGVGDAVVVQDAVRIVKSIGSKHVTLLDPTTGRVSTFDRGTVDEAPILARSEAQEAVVVSAAKGELQVLDPWTLATVSVLKPAGMEDAPLSVQVVRWEGELVVLPAV
ncbi:MAG TPA: NMD3-related protein, partial [Candidatus Thermoplasmatota archaeon]|nr:NMD3-related protein [Candidatus Thermoplasmatota archaeon]